MAAPRMHRLLKAVAIAALVLEVAMECRAEHIGPISRGGCVKCEMDVTFLSKTSFYLDNIRLSDTCCDDRPVYFYAQAYEQNNFPKHYSHLGCNQVGTWPGGVTESYADGVPYLHIYCCVDEGIFGSDQCAVALVNNPL